MANKALFSSLNKGNSTRTTVEAPQADTVNEAGGKAYAYSPEHHLAQLAATGCLNSTYYSTGEEQLDKAIELANKCNPKFVAQVAVFARERAFMKDMPALLCAVLAKRDVSLLKKVFSRVIDNGKMLRNFCQIVRSGKAGRKSFGSAPKRLVREWLGSRDDRRLLEASIGNDPSLADIIKMVHPKAKDNARSAFYAYLLGKEHKRRDLPEIVRAYEDYKAGDTKAVPDVPFQLLTALKLGKKEWTEIALNAKWHMARMNLNTFQRHGVFESKQATQAVADKLRDPEAIRRSKVFPYQLLVAYLNAADIPQSVSNALQDAMEIACENVPEIDGKVYVFPDVSGSMSSPVTGQRGSITSKMRCIDVAALVAAALVRKNAESEVIPFESHVEHVKINPRDSIMTNAAKLASIGGGGTNCSAPLAELNSRKAKGDLLVYVSDNESWVDSSYGWRGSTGVMEEWAKFKERSPKAKMVCIDIQPNGSTQAVERKDILNVGGFSDEVFTIISDFAAGRLDSGHWVGEIERISL